MKGSPVVLGSLSANKPMWSNALAGGTTSAFFVRCEGLPDEGTTTVATKDGEKRMLKHKTDNAFHCRPEWFISKNAIIGDAVITTDNEGRVTSLNPVAQSLTGWTQADAVSLSFVVVRKYRSPTAGGPFLWSNPCLSR